MNLILSFVHPAKELKTLGPFTELRLDADGLSEGEKRFPVALYRDQQWEVGGERYFRLDCVARVRIHFENGKQRNSRRYGPYNRFSAVDGMAYTDGKVFAFVDRRVGDWFCYDDGYHWPVMVVADTGAARKDGILNTLAALVPQVAGVYALWEGAKLLYLGHVEHDLRGRLLELVPRNRSVTAWTWEASARPAAREAELLAEYASASPTLRTTYGRIHGTAVRASQLLEQARMLVGQARARRLNAS